MGGLYMVLASLLSPISLPIARTLSLPRLPEHFPTVLLAYISFQLVELVSPLILASISPIHFGHANSHVKHNWVLRVVSMAHALTIIPLAFLCLDLPELDQDRAYGFDSRVGHVNAIACGFIWDTLESIFHFTSIGFIVHGATCLIVYALSFRPFLGYYGVRFLLWELSTPFLNIHWILDKTNRTGGTLQIINGIILMVVFFLARLCYGGWMSIRFFYTLKGVQAEIPTVVALAYALGNLALQGLNWIW
ncbi:DUF887-domain-containing protein [Gautieria morchelliformis]|nr:DUF887-domain-containing protein [Gautieria morchelliformis]